MVENHCSIVLYSYIHLSSRIGKHSGFHLKTESSVKDHIMFCDACANTKYNVNFFKIIKNCNSIFETKIHEVLLIKKHNLGLNRQLFANESSFLLKRFYVYCYLCRLDSACCIGFAVVNWRLYFLINYLPILIYEKFRSAFAYWLS